jgi:hypothetical protein
MKVFVAIYGNGEEVTVGYSRGSAAGAMVEKLKLFLDVEKCRETGMDKDGNTCYDIIDGGETVDGFIVIERELKEETISEQLSRTQME